MVEQHPFKRRHLEAEIILLCVRWYLRYALSYRDLEEMMRNGDCRWTIPRTTVGAALCSRAGQTLSTSPQSVQRLLESG